MINERLNPHGMNRNEPVTDYPALALFLGGSDDSWTGAFLRLVAKSDPEHRDRLREAFPVHVAAWEAWRAMARPTVGDLIDAIEGVPG